MSVLMQQVQFYLFLKDVRGDHLNTVEIFPVGYQPLLSFDMDANRYRKSLQAEGQPPISAEICRFHIAELI